MSDAPIWSETIHAALTWRQDGVLTGQSNLFVNGLFVGAVYQLKRHYDPGWRSFAVAVEGGADLEGTPHPTESAAKDALVDAVVRELGQK
jgi:hypothetical protein